MKILLVDDDPTIVNLVTQFLSLSAHHEVEVASSVRTALQMIAVAEEPFECFLVDIQMPEADGITLVYLIREMPDYQQTPVIMLTAMAEKHYLDRAFSAGATDYVTKPFDYMDLRQRLQAARILSTGKANDCGRTSTPGELDRKTGVPNGSRLSDPISLPGLVAAVEHAEFENYLRQLTRRRLFEITAMAVKIGLVDRLFSEVSSEKFELLIRDVAKLLQNTFLAEGGVFSYRGNGIFVCIPERRLAGRRGDLIAALNMRYHALYPPTGRIASCLLVGEQVQLGRGTDVGAREALASAIDDAENQNLALANTSAAPSHHQRKQRFAGEHGYFVKRGI